MILDIKYNEKRMRNLSFWWNAGQNLGHKIDQMFGKNNWSTIKRFAILQGEKYRFIDDASDGRNLTMQMSVHIHTPSPAAAAVVARHYRKVLGRKLSKVFR